MVYQEWYERILTVLPSSGGEILELGSGAGFLPELIPGVITSEILIMPGVAATLDACRLPFRTGALRAIVMTDVLHHIPKVGDFLREAANAVRPGGVIAMVEPWRTPWSEFVFRNFHHEPFQPDSGWEFPVQGPLSSANGALPWILFDRDRALLERDFPMWRIEIIEGLMPVRYLLSGGFTMPALQPPATFTLWRAIEKLPIVRTCSMFALIVLRRLPD